MKRTLGEELRLFRRPDRFGACHWIETATLDKSLGTTDLSRPRSGSPVENPFGLQLYGDYRYKTSSGYTYRKWERVRAWKVGLRCAITEGPTHPALLLDLFILTSASAFYEPRHETSLLQNGESPFGDGWSHRQTLIGLKPRNFRSWKIKLQSESL